MKVENVHSVEVILTDYSIASNKQTVFDSETTIKEIFEWAREKGEVVSIIIRENS